jgi:NADPH2:quinone reductase
MVAGDYVAREVSCLADDGRIVIIAVQGGVKSEFNAGGPAPPPDDHRLDAASRPVAFKGPSPRRCARRSGRCWRRAHQAGDRAVFPAAQAARRMR